ncbi:MAG: hypothetical protein ACKVQW_06245 [Pyrinomonadaceae bacterium]
MRATNLANDLGIDLAIAFLVEQKYRQKLDSTQAREFIAEIGSVLYSLENPGNTVDPNQSAAATAAQGSH